MSKTVIYMAMALLAASAALAHTGVTNATVKARMDGMERISAATKAIGLMARGASPFDMAELARQSAILTEEAERIPALFKPRADDPKSEALPAIWTNWDDFVAKSDAMATAANTLGDVTSAEALAPAVRSFGQTCVACHDAYRE